MPAEHLTLTRFLSDERCTDHRCDEDVRTLVIDAALQCRTIAQRVAYGAIDGAPRALSAERPQRRAQGRHVLLFEPFDGAGADDGTGPAGSVFSLLRSTELVGAGYAVYGPATVLVVSLGAGVHGFTLDPQRGEFVLTHRGLRIPEAIREVTIDAAGRGSWEPAVRRYVDERVAGATATVRWSGSTAARTHRVLTRGGVAVAGRHVGEDAVAFLVEQAGGRVAHRPAATIIGNAAEVERIERYHRDGVVVPFASPLYGTRGLFRTATA
ncbi:hypothetical protein [Pseudonocardia sp. GCM10023141]|uniref:hypothetical protein n=1 Tax=Pseudonocardia sp. GCM10023141 TaxID=3252653 RepID=UPI003608FBF8